MRSSASESVFNFSSFSFPLRLKGPIYAWLCSDHVAALMGLFSETYLVLLALSPRTTVDVLVILLVTFV